MTLVTIEIEIDDEKLDEYAERLWSEGGAADDGEPKYRGKPLLDGWIAEMRHGLAKRHGIDTLWFEPTEHNDYVRRVTVATT